MDDAFSIGEAHLAMERGEISALDLTQRYLNEAKSNRFGAFLSTCEERAFLQARNADSVIAKNKGVPRAEKPLLGIPIAVKDLIAVEGTLTTCGSKILGEYSPPYTATAVRRLEDAGAVIIGKTNLDEFGMGSSNENSAFGPVLHPTYPKHVAGGSSGGSAAAVKSGACIGALGTDTGGSVRLPASFCGVVGLKPTYGRVSRYGVVAYGSSLDQIGPMARSVEDVAVLMDVMAGHDPLDATSSVRPRLCALKKLREKVEWSELRIGIPSEYFVKGLAPGVEKAIQASLKWFEKKGCKLVPVSLPHTQYAVSVYYIVAVSEASSNLARFDGIRFGVRPPGAETAKSLQEYYEQVRSLFGSEVKRRIILGTFALSSGYSKAFYLRACQVRRKISEDFLRAFEKVDLILGPVAPQTAFKLGEKMSDPLQMYLSDIFTIPANLAGIPAVSIPCGEDEAGLPVGLQILGPAFSEERILQVAHAFDTARQGALK